MFTATLPFNKQFCKVTTATMLQSKAPWPQAEQARTMRPGGLWQKQGLPPKAAKEETGQQMAKLGAGVFTGEQQGLGRRPGPGA